MEPLPLGDRLQTPASVRIIYFLNIYLLFCPLSFLSFSFLFMLSFLLSFSQAVNCPVDTSNPAETWSQTLSGTTATSTCNGGYYSSLGPQRNCTQSQSNGVWGTVINPCNGDDYSLFLMHKRFSKETKPKDLACLFFVFCFLFFVFCFCLFQLCIVLLIQARQMWRGSKLSLGPLQRALVTLDTIQARALKEPAPRMEEVRLGQLCQIPALVSLLW